MKKISIRILGVFVLVALIFSACDKWIDADMNINPDAPLDVPMSTILPAIEANMAYNTIGGSDICRITNIWLQYLAGNERQSQSTSEYILSQGDINNQWNTNYAETMMNCYQVIQKATNVHPHYLGIAQILMANSLGITTDVWNDIPYTQAFQGDANLTPAFDTQQQIYDTILSLLDNAILNLQIVGNYENVGGDIMYGGDLSLWLKAAYAFKARYALHLCKRDPNAYQNALDAVANAFTANAEDLQFNFGEAYPESNPLYQFMQERGDITMHAYFINLLLQRVDPRIVVYATQDAAGGYSGNEFGEYSYDVSGPGPAISSPNSPVPFITYAECLFIKAECEYVTGAPDAQVRQTLVNGLAASLEKQGVYSEQYVNAYDSAIQNISGDTLFAEIMMQKYIALFYQAEPFSDWRRTGIPVLTPNPFAARPEIPRRYPYPTEEITYNPNVPPYGDIWNPVWWDFLLTK